MTKHYVVLKNGNHEIITSNSDPSHEVGLEGGIVVCESPVGTGNEDIIDIVDVVDEVTKQVVGKRAVVNAKKKLDKQIAQHDAATKEKWKQMRAERNQLLRETDFLLLEDAPVNATKKNEIKTYRKALRDLPGNITDINNIIWPVKPELE